MEVAREYLDVDFHRKWNLRGQSVRACVLTRFDFYKVTFYNYENTI